MGMVLLKELEDRFQADLWVQALEDQGIPHLLRTFMDTAYDGLFVSQKGYGRIFVEEEWLDKAREIDAELAGSAEVAVLPPAELARKLDHTLLDPMAGEAELEAFLDQCLAMGCAAACLPPWLTAPAARKLAGSPVKVCVVAGFPLGFETTAAKVAQARELVELGAQEVDVVLNRGLALMGRVQEAAEEMAAVARAAAPAEVKVIMETSALGPELGQAVARELAAAGISFLKTGTGFFGPATVEEVGWMRAAAGPAVRIKAAGGIKDLDGATALIAAGADRLGASAGWAIYQEAVRLWEEAEEEA